MSGSGIGYAFKETVSAVTATKPAYISLGTLRYEGGREYVYVYNGGGEQIAPTYGAILQSGASGYTVTITSVASYSVMFGIVRGATITTAANGWLMKKGVTTFEAGVESFALRGGIVAGAAGVFEPASTISGQSADIGILNVCGIPLASLGTGTSGLGYFNCM